MKYYIKAGYGYNYGQNFSRVSKDTEVTEVKFDGAFAYGKIKREYGTVSFKTSNTAIEQKED